MNVLLFVHDGFKGTTALASYVSSVFRNDKVHNREFGGLEASSFSAVVVRLG